MEEWSFSIFLRLIKFPYSVSILNNLLQYSEISDNLGGAVFNPSLIPWSVVATETSSIFQVLLVGFAMYIYQKISKQVLNTFSYLQKSLLETNKFAKCSKEIDEPLQLIVG